MNLIAKISVFIIAFLLNIQFSLAQDNQLSNKYKEKAIQTLSQLMNDFYVFPDVAKRTEKHLLSQLKEGHFKKFETKESFANALTKSVQSINKDKHMRIMLNRSYEAPVHTTERLIEERLDRLERSRRSNYGFKTVKILEGNVGYIDLRGFAGLENAKPHADAAMMLMAKTDAIIFDLSKNGGGSPRMVQYLCSFFFNEKVHLNSLYWREGEVTNEFWTLDEVGGTKLPNVPLFIIMSNRTFSGAEEFSYNMQTQKRATLIGQTSGGGANPGGTRIINDDLRVFIPTGKAINPITKTNWEGVGVVPEIETTPDETLEKAHHLAKEAAKAYRAKLKVKYTKLLKDLNSTFDHYIEGESEEKILKGLTQCRNLKLLNEWDINTLGYEHLRERNKPKIAESIFRANTILHPESANVFDSYGEALMLNGDLQSSFRNYQKAVDIAIAKEDVDISLFKKNLEIVKAKMKEKK